jgi:hypothetical protein
MNKEKNIAIESNIIDSPEVTTVVEAEVVNDAVVNYEIEQEFTIQPTTKEQEDLIVNTLEKMEIEYCKSPKTKTITVICTEKEAALLQRNIKTNLFFKSVRNVSENVSGFVKKTADVVMQTGIEGASAAIKATTAVAGSVATAGIALGASTITNVSRTVKNVHRDLKYNQDIKDAGTEIKSAWNTLCSKLGGGSVGDGGLLRKVK